MRVLAVPRKPCLPQTSDRRCKQHKVLRCDTGHVSEGNSEGNCLFKKFECFVVLINIHI